MTDQAPEAPLGDRLDDMRLSGLSRVGSVFRRAWNAIPYPVRNFWPFRIIGSIISLVRRNRVLSLAAEISFWGVLSVVPLVIAAGSALGWLDTIAGTDVAESALEELTSLVNTLFGTNGTATSIKQLFEEQNTSALTLSLLVSLYSASRGFTSLIGALGLISGHQSQRNWLMTRVVGVFVSIFSIVLMNGLLILLGLNRSGLGLPEPWDRVADWAIFPVVFVLVVGWASVLLHWAPRERTPLRYDLPGSILTAIFWIGGSYLTAIYIAATASSSDPVGLLGSGLGLLIWLYVISASILIGAQLNAAMSADRMARASAGHPAVPATSATALSALTALTATPPVASGTHGSEPSSVVRTRPVGPAPKLRVGEAALAPSAAEAPITEETPVVPLSAGPDPVDYPEPHWADS